MQTKVNPAMIGIAIAVLIAFCVFMYLRANSDAGPRQLPPSGAPFKPGYDGGSAGPRNRPTGSAAHGAASGTTSP